MIVFTVVGYYYGEKVYEKVHGIKNYSFNNSKKELQLLPITITLHFINRRHHGGQYNVFLCRTTKRCKIYLIGLMLRKMGLYI